MYARGEGNDAIEDSITVFEAQTLVTTKSQTVPTMADGEKNDEERRSGRP